MTTEAPPVEDVEVEEDNEEDVEDFDKERALATIKKQRASERKLKEELREARKAQEELDNIKQAQEDAEKTAAQKLDEREAKIADLERKIAETAVKADFKDVAAERGFLDLDLAYLAAKEQGLLGTLNPKTGEIEGHDLDKLEELYPALAGEAAGGGFTGDAGIRGRQGKTGTIGGQFNQTVRSAITRR